MIKNKLKATAAILMATLTVSAFAVPSVSAAEVKESSSYATTVSVSPKGKRPGRTPFITTYGGYGKIHYNDSRRYAYAETGSWGFSDTTYLYASTTIGSASSEKDKNYDGASKARVLKTDKVYGSRGDTAQTYHTYVGYHNGTENYAASHYFR